MSEDVANVKRRRLGRLGETEAAKPVAVWRNRKELWKFVAFGAKEGKRGRRHIVAQPQQHQEISALEIRGGDRVKE